MRGRQLRLWGGVLLLAAVAVAGSACGSEELPQGLREFQLDKVIQVEVTAHAGSTIAGQVVSDPQVIRPIIGLLSSADSMGGVETPYPQGDLTMMLVTQDPYRLYALRVFRQQNRLLDPQTGTWYELPLGLLDLLPTVSASPAAQR